MFEKIRIVLLATFALGLPASLAGGAFADEPADDCRCRDIVVTCSVEPVTVLVGDPFRVTAEVTNTGNVELEKVILRIRGCPSARLADGERLEMVIARLPVGETRSLGARFIAEKVGKCECAAHAVDGSQVASAGCMCSALIKGLPAIQLEMIDVDKDRKPKGIFRMGEEFLYVVRIENDEGTALTPDLRVVWTLPPELEFVSGAGSGDTTVTGGGQSGESSPFVLAPPDGAQTFEIRVRVIGVPTRNLVQTKATVLSLGEQPLADETESTTLKN